MEYTKDAIYNVRYSKRFGMLNLRKKGVIKKILEFIKENKFITIIVISITLLTLIDLVLVNAFMNILIQV